MPNHIENELTAPSEVLDSLARDDRVVDFNTVIPMPEVLDSDSGEHINDWAKLAMGLYPLAYFQKPRPNPGDMAAAGNWGAAADSLHVGIVLRMLDKGPFPKDFSDADFAMLLKRMQAIKETGFVSWYEWSIKHWGTKWNAYQTRRVSDTSVRFQTAWSAPMPILDALSRKFRDDTIGLRWADEDTGANVGRITVKNGEAIEGGRVENYSREAYAIYLELHHDGVVPDHMELLECGTLKYKPEPVEAE